MSGSRPPFPGWTLAEAREKCVDPDLLEDEIETCQTWWRAGCPGRFRRLKAPRAINPVSKADGIRLDNARRRAASEATGFFRQLLVSGKLLARGRRGSPVLDAIPLPSSAWRSLRFLNLKTSIAREPKETSVKIYDVKVYPAIKAPNAVDLVSGLPFVEAFRRFVLEDPEVYVLGKQAIKVDSGYARVFEQGDCFAHGVKQWRVTWCDTVKASKDEEEMIGILNGPPPKEISCAEAALADRVAAFVTLLRDGTLVAQGIPHVSNLDKVVPRTVWSHRNYYFDAHQGDVLETNPDCEDPPRDMLLRRWSGILLERGDRSGFAPTTGFRSTPPENADSNRSHPRNVLGARATRSRAAYALIRELGIDLADEDQQC